MRIGRHVRSSSVAAGKAWEVTHDMPVVQNVLNCAFLIHVGQPEAVTFSYF